MRKNERLILVDVIFRSWSSYFQLQVHHVELHDHVSLDSDAMAL